MCIHTIHIDLYMYTYIHIYIYIYICGPTGDGKWSHHKSLSILSSEILKIYKCLRIRRYF